MKVELLNKEEVKNLFKNHGEFACTCYNTDKKYAEKVGKSCNESGHMSGSRCEYIKFQIECDRGCYDDQTEIMTANGWKLFKDISNNEIVATLNPETKNVEFHTIDEKIQYLINKDMHYYNSKTVNLMVTDNHKMYIKKHDVRIPQDYYLIESQDINVNRIHMYKKFNYNNNIDNTFIVKGYDYIDNGGNKKYSCDLKLDRKLFFRLLAWYLSDGVTSYNEKENSYEISITQTDCKENIDNKTKERINDIITQLGFHPYSDKKRVRFKNLTLGKYFYNLGISLNKYIPFNIFENFDKELAQDFINEYFKADGHLYKDGSNGKLYSSSKVLIDQLDVVCYIAGYTTKTYKRNSSSTTIINGRTVNVHNNGGYYINVSTGKCNSEPVMYLNKIKENIHYNGYVYCVNVKNHIIYVRRNGVAVWCGNCAEQIMRHEIGVRYDEIDKYAYSDRIELIVDVNPTNIVKNMQSFRYVDKNDFTYVIPKNINKYDDVKKVYDSTMKIINMNRKIIRDMLIDHGVKPKKAVEDANFVLPRATNLVLTIGFTPEALIQFMWKRLCSRAQDEIKEIAIAMKNCTKEVSDDLYKQLVPHCQHLLWCPEGKSCCGAYPTKKELQDKLKEMKSIE